jgi:MarR family transcriptional regulator for hemolysin
VTTNFPMGKANADQIGDTYFLIGLINRFNNSFQAVADMMFDELSWKQVFFMNCVKLFPEAPTIRDMAMLLGCSHQNAKQILSKLENSGYLRVQQDSADKRKQRIMLTEKAVMFQNNYEEPSEQAMQQLFAGISAENIESMTASLLRLTSNVERMKGGIK